MKDKLLIIGASGHGKVIADIGRLNGYREIFFLDDDENKKTCGGYPVCGRSGCFSRYDCDMFIAIGNASVRQRLQEKLEREGRRIATLIHPAAVIAEHVTIGAGTAVMAGAVINPDVVIGKGCIINTCASVDHDNRIADYAHISVGAHLAGTVTVGKRTWIGAGATVSNNLTITDDCMIGAGAVVVKNIECPGTYVGVPAGRVS